MADLVRVSDQSSEDPGSNRGWISISFFTLSLHTLLLRGHMSNYTQEPMKFKQDPCCSTMCNRTWEKGGGGGDKNTDHFYSSYLVYDTPPPS